MIDVLLSLPARLAAHLASREQHSAWSERLHLPLVQSYFFGSDPAGRKLGSGGGTVNLLHAAWKAAAPKAHPSALTAWIERTPRLVLHAGGESRRLPAYAGLGKAFMPLPPLPGIPSPRHDLMLCDAQLPRYTEALAVAGEHARVLVTSGDVWLDFEAGDLPAVKSDIVGLGMRVPPEVAQHFGVFFIARGHRERGPAEHEISFFLQKPSPDEIRRHAVTHDFFVDTGMWLLSAAAVRYLFRLCGWDDRRGFVTPDRLSGYLDLYTEVGGGLGRKAKLSPRLRAAGAGELRTSVVPLESARFEHFGSSRQLFEALDRLQAGRFAAPRHYFLSSSADSFTAASAKPVWVDASHAAAHASTRLDGWNLVSGLPAKHAVVALAEEHCLDVIPVAPDRFVVRPYRLDDTLRGTPERGATICGQPSAAWLKARGMTAPAGTDVFQLPLYPLLSAKEITQTVVDWFFAPAGGVPGTAPFKAGETISAAAIADRTDHSVAFAARTAGQLERLRKQLFAAAVPAPALFGTDFQALSTLLEKDPGLRKRLRSEGETLTAHAPDAVAEARLRMLLARVRRGADAARETASAFARLRTAVVAAVGLERVAPHHALKEDQIVWARSAVRLDLAGGWTDTPPYCFEYGGSVINVAVTLNGQPPIQVFVRRIREPEIRIRSIDLGVEQTLRTRAELGTFADPRSGFSLPKAALALAGFVPDHHRGPSTGSLRQHLKALGGGLEMSLLCAVPKGSGLGTSSILGATLLGALNRSLALGWDRVDLYHRVLAMEQLLTTGGGWQDQAGAIFPGVKLVQTEPGFAQRPTVRYLPNRPLREVFASGRFLLYYTGLTRYAKGILQEIVHRMLLGERTTVLTLREIHANARRLQHALQEADMAAVTHAIRRSWILNRRLDPGTNTPEVQGILDLLAPADLAAAKLLGAGGGGYLLLCANDDASSQRIRRTLEDSPPNARARFVEAAVSENSFEVTMS